MIQTTFERPPEGPISGEDVPTNSEENEIEEQKIQRIMNSLKIRGEPWISMPEEERREKALEIYHEVGQ